MEALTARRSWSRSDPDNHREGTAYVKPIAEPGAGCRQIALLLALEATFCDLAVAGSRHRMLDCTYPWYVWTLLGVFAAFAVAWVWALVKK